MGECVDKLLALSREGTAYDVPYADVRELQIAALDERLQEQGRNIKLVDFRARQGGISKIRTRDDVVPLLLPHTAYKSYPENLLVEQKWDRLTKWLGTVSAYPLNEVDLDGITGIDDWIGRLEKAGHFVSCTSGTTGKAAMLVASRVDMEWTAEDAVLAQAWGTGVEPAQDRLVFGFAAMADVPRNRYVRDAIAKAHGVPGKERFNYPIPSITIGSITEMIALRKAIADGTARPGQIADYDAISASRQQAMDAAVGLSADAIIAARHEKLQVSGMWAVIHGIATEVRNRGFSAKDFHAENSCVIAGGLKGAVLPPDYREFVYETFNLRPENNYQMYGMQEIGSALPRCHEGGRYHIPPWVVCLLLDKDGDALVPMSDGPGEVEGRAAFFDLSLDGRWGGVISGDKVQVDFGACACGARTPSIRDNIVRYSDLEGDDKISCSGTVDAYVRGMA